MDASKIISVVGQILVVYSVWSIVKLILTLFSDRIDKKEYLKKRIIITLCCCIGVIVLVQIYDGIQTKQVKYQTKNNTTYNSATAKTSQPKPISTKAPTMDERTVAETFLKNFLDNNYDEISKQSDFTTNVAEFLKDPKEREKILQEYSTLVKNGLTGDAKNRGITSTLKYSVENIRSVDATHSIVRYYITTNLNTPRVTAECTLIKDGNGNWKVNFESFMISLTQFFNSVR